MTIDAAYVATLPQEEQAAVLLPFVEAVADSYSRRNKRLDRGEVYSEALVAFAEALRSYDEKRGELPAYVIAKVKLHLADYNRSNTWMGVGATRYTERYGRPQLVSDGEVPERLRSTPATGLRNMIDQEEIDALRASWEELPADQRGLLRALHYEGKTREDVARDCGVTRSAIDHRYLQAVKKLRLLMGVSK